MTVSVCSTGLWGVGVSACTVYRHMGLQEPTHCKCSSFWFDDEGEVENKDCYMNVSFSTN